MKMPETVMLMQWTLDKYSAPSADNGFGKQFDSFLADTVPAFEKKLSEALRDITEGERTAIDSARFERSPLARRLCLEYHGTACKICGMDFAAVYGEEFSGKTEVHHIVPLSEIGRNYIVDPVKDMIPVCPNCHTALHSKPGGVYTPEELKKIMNTNP